MKKFASLDIGSNSIILCIAEKDEFGNLQYLLDHSEITRLGEGLHLTGFLNNDAMERSYRVIKKFLSEAKSYGISDVAAVGTMALRNANNSKEFLSFIKLKTGLNIEIISGEEEARLSFIAVKKGLPESEGGKVVFDTGGGSTEIIQGTKNEILNKFSLNIGAVKLTELYLTDSPVSERIIKIVEEKISDEFGNKLEGLTSNVLIGTGGTVTNLASIKLKLKDYDSRQVHNSIVTEKDIKNQIELFSTKTIEERKLITGLQPKRADVILAGALIIKTIMQKLKTNSFIVSNMGIRHGLIFDRF
jgi:exopolyphosphatase/guanosine-5'-triphosphate,3'-diphosphate pyrophosphatase